MSDCSLADNKCVPCRGGIPALTPDEIAPLMAKLSDWQLDDGKRLTKTYKFKNFAGAMTLANAIWEIADSEGHHPDLLVAWGKVGVTLWTHKIDGLTQSDFFMAAKIDRANESLTLPV